MTIQQLQENETIKQVLAESCGGLMYNLDNQGKYESAPVLEIWGAMSQADRDMADGILKGAIQFLQGEE